MVTVPDVSTGACRTAAPGKLIRDQGLVVERGDPMPSNPECPNPNRIVAQEPAAGTQVEAGSTVVVFPGGGDEGDEGKGERRRGRRSSVRR